MCFAAPKTSYNCWCHFRFIALPGMNLFRSEKDMKDISKALGVECDTSDGWKKRSEMDRKSREPMENIISANCDLRTHMLHAYGSIGLSLLAQVWNQVSNLPTIASHAVALRLKSSKWIIGGWCKNHGHERYAFVWFEWGSQIEEVVILRSVQHQNRSNFSKIAKIITALFYNNKKPIRFVMGQQHANSYTHDK